MIVANAESWIKLSVPKGYISYIDKDSIKRKGEKRPSIDAIVRLFSWLVYRNDDFQEHDSIKSVIDAGGYDPDYDWVEENT